MVGYNALNLGFTASGSITTGNVVEISAANTVKQGTASTKAAIGVAFSGATDGNVVTVQADGIAKVIAGGAIAAGARVVAGATGKVVTIGSGTFDQVIGKALTAASSDGDEIEILIGSL